MPALGRPLKIELPNIEIEGKEAFGCAITFWDRAANQQVTISGLSYRQAVGVRRLGQIMFHLGAQEALRSLSNERLELESK
jgi:hypothetical protein